MKWIITGDCHGEFSRFWNLPKEVKTAIIVLGDFGINYYLNKTDIRKKKELYNNYPNFIFYCVRGNHEARPQDIPTMKKVFDDNVHGVVYCEPEYPNIRYFLDHGLYDINNYSCYVIGGAYSVDKYWRLSRFNMTEETNISKSTGWFANEQLTKEEMYEANKELYKFTSTGKTIDFVFSHTCPYSYEPRDMFLSSVDQSTVDNTMEKWMDDIKGKFNWNIWCFGHFHADRIERSHVEQFYKDMEELDEIVDRWKKYDDTKELPWYLTKGPNFNLCSSQF